MANGWIGVDLDGTLFEEIVPYNGNLGAPVPAMVERVKAWLAAGEDVRLVTARVSTNHNPNESARAHLCRVNEQYTKIIGAVFREFGVFLPILASKDHLMRELWDDRAVCVRHNTGEIIGEPNRDDLPILGL
jgi:hypothetical protein